VNNELRNVYLKELTPIFVHHHMIVITHHRIPCNINRIDRGQLLDSISNPPSAMLIIATTNGIFTAKKSSAHTTVYAVIPRSIFN